MRRQQSHLQKSFQIKMYYDFLQEKLVQNRISVCTGPYATTDTSLAAFKQMHWFLKGGSEIFENNAIMVLFDLDYSF